jgi:hypothetical protein
MATPTVAAAGATVTTAGATVAARMSTIAADAAAIANNAICATKAARRVFFDQSQIEVLAHSGQQCDAECNQKPVVMLHAPIIPERRSDRDKELGRNSSS